MIFPKLRNCQTCLFNVVFRCEIIFQALLKQTGFTPPPERVGIFKDPVPCKKWKDRKYLKCNKCKFAVCNETGRPITCAQPIPVWAIALVGFSVLQKPITKELSDNCEQFKER